MALPQALKTGKVLSEKIGWCHAAITRDCGLLPALILVVKGSCLSGWRLTFLVLWWLTLWILFGWLLLSWRDMLAIHGGWGSQLNFLRFFAELALLFDNTPLKKCIDLLLHLDTPLKALFYVFLLLDLLECRWVNINRWAGLNGCLGSFRCCVVICELLHSSIVLLGIIFQFLHSYI